MLSATLFDDDAPAALAGPELRLLSGLNPNEPAFVRLAAMRIGVFEQPHMVEAALLEAHTVGYMGSVESLAAMFIADRLRTRPRAVQLVFLAGLQPTPRRKVELHLERLRCAAREGVVK